MRTKEIQLDSRGCPINFAMKQMENACKIMNSSNWLPQQKNLDETVKYWLHHDFGAA